MYVGEVVTTALGICFCASGLFIVSIMYTGFGASLSDTMDKLEFMFDIPLTMGAVWGFFDMLVFLVPLTVGFVTARSSAILSIAGFVSAAFMLIMIQGILPGCGVAASLHRISHRTTH